MADGRARALGPAVLIRGSVLGGTTDTSFLRRTALFATLPEQSLRMLQASGETMFLAPGRMVFAEGTAGNDLYVVKSGVLEVLKGERAVSYLSAGECLGEMSLLTGAPRSATIRVLEKAEVLRIPGLVFERILQQNAEVSLALARILAHRLELTSQLKSSEGKAGRHLVGDLQFFDLGEISQTLMQSRRTGVLRLSLPTMSGEHALWFDDGLIRFARLGPLEGLDAAIALLRLRGGGTFDFEGQATYSGPEASSLFLDGSMGLLLEAARHDDEIGALREMVPAALQRKGDDFPWRGRSSKSPAPEERSVGDPGWEPGTEADRLFALEVWDAIAEEVSLDVILGRFFGRELLTLKVLRALQHAGLLL